MICGITKQGRRSDNQDSFWAAEGAVNGESGIIACVCDGVGGLEDGRWASSIAVSSIREMIRFGTEVSLDSLLSRLEEVNTEINARGRVGTTCTILVAVSGRYVVIHTGDTRVYHIEGANGSPKCITYDHTGYNYYLERGTIRPVEGDNSTVIYKGQRVPASAVAKYKSQLTRCLGGGSGFQPDILHGTYNQGDSWLIASDGFWHSLSASGGWTRLFSQGDVTPTLSMFMDNFINNGEGDNLTAVYARPGS